jgi:hypothetical protein
MQNLWQSIRPRLWTLPAALLLGVALFLGRRFHRVRRNDTARARRQKAPKAARKALHAAEHARQRSDTAAFYDALWHAMADYFGHRLNLPPGDVTASAVLQALVQNNFTPEQINTLSAIFEQVESSRYGRPEAVSPEEMKKLQSSLEQILKHCEKIKFCAMSIER